MRKILFLSWGNSCRSIMAEAIFNHLAHNDMQAFSAGSIPAGKVHPPVSAVLKENGINTAGYRSKSWDEFSGTPLDLVIYLCDRAAGELCPEFTGNPIRAHWNQPDIFQVHHDDPLAKMTFEDVYECLEMRIRALLRLPLASMKRDETAQRLDDIGRLIRDRRALRFIHPAVFIPKP